MVRIPYFHYTSLNNLVKIFRSGQLNSRSWLIDNSPDFEDISIDPEQKTRLELGLLDFVPIFPGYIKKYYREPQLHRYLQEFYDEPVVYNRSFYGALNKTLREEQGDEYEEVILLLLNHRKIIDYANEGYVRYFTNIAIKGESVEMECNSVDDLMSNLSTCMGDNGHLYCEIDVLDAGGGCFLIPDDIEAIIVDNAEVKEILLDNLNGFLSDAVIESLNIIVAPLPRDD